MSIETLILSLVVVGGAVLAMSISLLLARYADEARRMIQHKCQTHYGGEAE